MCILAIFMFACGPQEPSPQKTEVPHLPADAAATSSPDDSQATGMAYPLPPDEAYPLPVNYGSEGAYPQPVEEVVQESDSGVIPFQITKPIYTGAVQVTGTATPGLPLFLVNVTMVGEILGETIVQDNGTFTFDVTPIDSGTRIGVVLGNLEGTPWSIEDFYAEGYYGDEARVVPMVGFLYDTALVMDK